MSLVYFVFLEIPPRWLDTCPIALPPPKKEEALVSSITSGAQGAQCLPRCQGLSSGDMWMESGVESVDVNFIQQAIPCTVSWGGLDH